MHLETSRARAFRHFILAAILLSLVGWLDSITSYEVALPVLYYFPIAYAAWYLGRGWSFAFAIASAAILSWIEISGGRPFSRAWIAWEHGFMRVLGFGFVAFSFNYFKRTLSEAERKMRAFSGPLPICPCCHRLDGGQGFWIDFPTFLRKNSDAVPEFTRCPVCVEAGSREQGAGSRERGAGAPQRGECGKTDLS